jgi:hypothetical protein
VPTTLKRNVVSKASVLAAGTQKIYDEWIKIPPGLRTSGMWRGEGLGIKKPEQKKPKAYFDPEDCLLPDRVIGLYDKSQTYLLTEPTRSKRILINRFVRRNDLFGLRPVGADRPIHRHTNFLCGGSVGDLVYSSFNYKHGVDGTPTRFLWEGEPIHADAFYVLAPDETLWFVIDIDNHSPTIASTKAHLLLVHHLVKKMPAIAQRIGASSVFYDYAQESPQGIHIWVTLSTKHGVKALHDRVRKTLQKMADPAIDANLKKCGLKPMGSLEILPTKGQLIRMFGSYERRVFTTQELLPKNEGFDAESLLAHIESKTVNGNPCGRYAELAVAGLGNAICEAPPAISVPSTVIALSSTAPTQRSGYMSQVVEACLNGITEGDVLFEGYLSPLAQALYWREFHDQPDRARLTQDALVRWIDKKHNWMVTRIRDRKRKLVVDQIRHVVKKLPATPPGIQAFWGKVVANDLAHPHQKVSFVACMEAVMAKPVAMNRNTLKNLPLLLNGGVGKSAKGNTYNVSSVSSVSSSSLASLPPLLETRLRDHLQRAKVRTGKCQQRVIDFAFRLLNEIGLRGTRTIDGKRMNQLAGLGHGRKHILRYKRLLDGAGILEPWKNTYSKIKKLAARYDLTPWALDEVRGHWGSPETAT